ncbi:MAG: endonuclease/exonuclease/phosphatase family protein [Prevotellaceae bacterium]|nr:endonuclease/exonuclease/phosphatase family protein [Prevotella sp.]MDD7258259.1 endonuclease/exonuclease/phosphatase family protein [Prevotellaceae bacterium]MDY6130964.1 endonuclease/exonuclease/phosphatase family protein [Prevotella sp.]
MSFTYLLLGIFTFVELNCENLFDCQRDSIKDDTEFTADGMRRWDVHKYWTKLNNIGKEILSCGGEGAEWQLPDIVALCEVENDSVVRDLTKRSVLRNAGYEYVMTDSPDERGIDVALLYSPYTFRLIRHYSLCIGSVKKMRKTRDILYVAGQTTLGDTLHIYVVHAPSRFGGKRVTNPFRMAVVEKLAESIDSLHQRIKEPNIIVAGDFNDHHDDESLRLIYSHGVHNISCLSRGKNGAEGTYKFKGKWEHIDHILASQKVEKRMVSCHIHDKEFLLETDKQYGGVQPLRTYRGYRYNRGYSDHLPLVARFNME